MWFDFLRPPARKLATFEPLAVNGRSVPLVFVRHPRARRYVLRLRRDGSARVTIPRGGSAAEARRFAERNQDWLARALHRLASQPPAGPRWTIGAQILFRGEPATLLATTSGGAEIRLGDETLTLTDAAADLRPAIERHLWRQAAREFPPRVLAFAAAHQLTIRRVTVRNQRSRWGSCSRRGTISLNWRLIQTPLFVQDYIILHELMHRRQMNHSARFWRQVESVCPDYAIAERWLKQHAALLR